MGLFCLMFVHIVDCTKYFVFFSYFAYISLFGSWNLLSRKKENSSHQNTQYTNDMLSLFWFHSDSSFFSFFSSSDLSGPMIFVVQYLTHTWFAWTNCNNVCQCENRQLSIEKKHYRSKKKLFLFHWTEGEKTK